MLAYEVRKGSAVAYTTHLNNTNEYLYKAGMRLSADILLNQWSTQIIQSDLVGLL